MKEMLLSSAAALERPFAVVTDLSSNVQLKTPLHNSTPVASTSNSGTLPRFSLASPLHYFEVTNGNSASEIPPAINAKISERLISYRRQDLK